MAAAGAVEEAPALAWLAPVAICSVCIALLYAYTFTLGAVLQVIADHINVKISGPGFSIRPFAFIANGINALNSIVRNALGVAIAANSYSWRKFVNWQSYIWHETSRLVGDLATETELTFRWLVKHHLGDVIFAYLNPISASVDLLRKAVHALSADTAKVARVTTRIVVHDIPRVERIVVTRTPIIVKHYAYTVAGGIANPWPRIRRAERDVAGIEKQVEGLGRKVLPAALVGAVAVALSKLGLDSARCSRTQKWDKALCGMDQDLLNALIADTLIIFGTVDLVRAARDMQAVLEPMEESVRKFWRAG